MRHKGFISVSVLGVSISAALIAATMANGQAKIPENPHSEVSVICGASVLPGVKAVEPETVETVKVVTGDFPVVVLPIPERNFAKAYTDEELEMLITKAKMDAERRVRLTGVELCKAKLEEIEAASKKEEETELKEKQKEEV